uniref:Chymotrypsin-like elastase family member 2B n=1 Tax=Schistocephalus solidus TaxID=70667 RepID=A0A0X3PNZ1_SCHSO
MQHSLPAIVCCLLFDFISNAFEIEPGFPTACGISAFPRTFKYDATRMKVPATPNSWPWHVGLWPQRAGYFPFCGGTLISDSLVVTAAHCVHDAIGCRNTPFEGLIDMTITTDSALYVLVGAHDYTTADLSRQLHRLQFVVIHPNFTEKFEDKGYDIAILKLAHRITPDKTVRPICFPAKHIQLKVGSTCYYAGWGQELTSWSRGKPVYPKSLREAEVQIDYDAHCLRISSYQFADSNTCIYTKGRVSDYSVATAVNNLIVNINSVIYLDKYCLLYFSIMCEFGFRNDICFLA